LSLDVKNRYGLTLSSAGAIGVSAMMHGYLAFDKNGNQLVPFRTWRNTTTEKAAALLTEKFKFNIPKR
jgi:sugar (pentulose or hexulose) kinase